MDENLKRGTVLDDYMAFDEVAKKKPKNRKPAQRNKCRKTRKNKPIWTGKPSNW